MSERDLLIGVVTGDRTWDDIKVWYKSARASGYTGDITLLVYGDQKLAFLDEIHNKITDPTFDIRLVDYGDVRTLSDFMAWRFKWVYDYLKSYRDYRYVCITDVNDVVFQDNWTKDVEFNKVAVGGENLKYADEPWSRHNMLTCFGSEEFADIRDEEIMCAGVIAGGAEYVRGFCLLLWTLARTGKPSLNGGGPDQAAMNILLRGANFGGLDDFERSDIIAHLGTHTEAIKAGSGDVSLAGKEIFGQLLWPEHNIYNNNGEYSIETEGQLTPIVHQYTRIPYLRDYFRNKYA